MTLPSTFTAWLTDHCHLAHPSIAPLPGDASFRRYYRIHTEDKSLIAMDASTEKHSCIPFIAIANALRREGLSVPTILANDIEQGYILLSDLGDQTYLTVLNQDNAKRLYANALDALAITQGCRDVRGWTLKPFTAEFMRNELKLFQEWFLEKYLQLELTPATQAILHNCFDFLSESAAQQKQVFMHRDYHSANLMLLSNGGVGILDFQDAFIGPVTYDLVSLLRDCYITWPEEFVRAMVSRYWQQLALQDVSEEEFHRWFDLMGLQRHMKALLTFSRKYCRDQNANYLQHIPRTLHYILTISQRYTECHALHNFLLTRVMTTCEQ